ncbi:hypothetical protein EBN88_07180 [Streptomyces triticirhizae]|uniref:Uncharacterized protein n=1 Tax=Streptomyces triticirhizae TaxID=2483353 RepID=A0A3M2M1J2_9ACTN|nr:hypothetical protein EBN88_07180 [Streptomyces triticirhizae]
MDIPHPYSRRVAVLAEVLDRPAELDAIRERLAALDWPVRDPDPDERPPHRPGRRHLIVEVRLRRAAWRAEKAAEESLNELASRHGLALWVRESRQLTHERGRWRRYRVVPRQPEGASALERRWNHLRALAGVSERRVWAPATMTRQEISDWLATHQLAGHRYAEATHRIVPAPPERADDVPEPLPLERVIVGAVALVAAAFCGYAMPGLSGAGYAVPALLVPAAALAIAFATRWEPLAVRLTMPVVLAAGVFALGWQASAALPSWSPSNAVLSLLVAVLALGLAPGIHHAFRGTWLSRNGPLVLTIALPSSGVLIALLGRLIQTSYLEQFGIPRGEVRTQSELWEYFAAGKPLGLALGLCLLILGVVGWIRHFFSAPAFLAVPVTVTLCVVYALTAVVLAAEGAGAAAEQAKADFRAGRTPASYFGLHPSIMCVRPTGEGPVAVENGPVPTDRPVLSFGASGTWIWLWDAQRDGDATTWRTFAARREDIQLTAPTTPDCAR